MPPIVTLPPTIADRLDVVETVGVFHGAQKYVFVCRRSLGDLIVVKMFKQNFVERDRREIEFYVKNKQLLGIPKVIGLLEIDNDTIVVEEYIKGNILRKVQREYLHNSKKIKNLCRNIFLRMEPIWDKGYVHRDLKPENIIIHDDGSPYIIDFGVFKNPERTTITSTDFQPHTKEYAAPEQLIADKNSISYRTDFFSLGVIAYELRYGVLPFGNTEEQILHSFRGGQLNCTLTDGCELNEFLLSVLQFNVSMRPGRLNKVLEALA